MSRETVTYKISMTETQQFRRLVEFLYEMESYARVTADEDLAERVESCQDDMAAMFGKLADDA